MFGWTKIFTLIAVAAAVAVGTGGAGATSTPTLASATASHATAAGKASTAAARSGALLTTANLSTRAGAARYLRAIGVDPRGLVIQRSARNYAGPNCPGAGWACTSAAHPVVQIAAAGGNNTFLCTTGSCVVVQATRSGAATRPTRPLTAAAAPNKATCNKTSGLMQSCTITQTSATAGNVAIVVERAKQASSVDQATSVVSAKITQQATVSNNNQACVYQDITETLAPTNKKGVDLTTALEGHQSIEINQDAASGDNTVQGAAAPPATAACVAGPLTQTQTLSSLAKGTAKITQNQNAADSGPNVSLDIKQNQGTEDATGLNKAEFSQTNTLTAIANTPAGPVSQTQSSPSGGISANVNQFSHGLSTASATQTETQCEHAQTSGSPTCTTGSPPLYSLTQKQYGPVKNTAGKSATAASRSLAVVRKDEGSTQGDNPDDVFTINQSSTQSNDTGQDQTNEVQGACTTSGNCTVSQTTTVNGETTTNTQSGQEVNTTTSCTGSSCTTPTNINIVGNNAAFGNGPIQTYDFNTGALVNSFVPEGATIDSNNGRAVLVVGNEVFYTELSGGGGATDFIRVAPFNGGAGGADIRTLPNPSSSGVQDLAFAGGVLYALTGYSGGPLQVFKLNPTNGAVLGGPVPITGSGQEASADGFAILPNGNFLINLADTSCTYNQYDSTTGAQIEGSSLTVPSASLCTGVATDGTSLYFQTDFNSFTQTDLAGNFIAKMTVQGNTVEDISLVGG